MPLTVPLITASVLCDVNYNKSMCRKEVVKASGEMICL